MTRPEILVRLLGTGDAQVLENVADDVFDLPVDSKHMSEFIADPRHHIAVALDGDTVVGFASGVHYVHPDKPAELFINEAGVADPYQRQGIAARLMATLLDEGRALGCKEAWVVTESDNRAARALYEKAGGAEDPASLVMYSFPLNAQA